MGKFRRHLIVQTQTGLMDGVYCMPIAEVRGQVQVSRPRLTVIDGGKKGGLSDT